MTLTWHDRLQALAVFFWRNGGLLQMASGTRTWPWCNQQSRRRCFFPSTKISSFGKLPRATQVTMPCTRQHMVVMQHCVLGCRSGPPGVSSGFNFWKNAWKIRHLFCDLVCQDYAALDPDQEDVRYVFFSQVKSLDHGFFGFGSRWLVFKTLKRGGKPVQPWQRRLVFRLGTDIQCIWVFPKIGFVSPQIIHFNRVFHCKSSILGYHYCWKPPFGQEKTALSVSFLEGFGTVACGSQSEEGLQQIVWKRAVAANRAVFKIYVNDLSKMNRCNFTGNHICHGMGSTLHVFMHMFMVSHAWFSTRCMKMEQHRDEPPVWEF